MKGKTMSETQITENDIDFYNSALTKMGESIPAEFIDALEEHAQEALTNYLKNNGAPKQVIDLISNVVLLSWYTERQRLEKMTDLNLVELVEIVPDVLRQISDLGGSFSSPAGPTNSKEPIPWGKGPIN
jgi:hypothetical protein